MHPDCSLVLSGFAEKLCLFASKFSGLADYASEIGQFDIDHPPFSADSLKMPMIDRLF